MQEASRPNYWLWTEGEAILAAKEQVLKSWETQGYGIEKDAFRIVVDRDEKKLCIICDCCKVGLLRTLLSIFISR